jgi:hypothetical protein
MDAVEGTYGFPPALGTSDASSSDSATPVDSGALAAQLEKVWRSVGHEWVVKQHAPAAAPRLEQSPQGAKALAALTPNRPDFFTQTALFTWRGLVESVQSSSFLFESIAVLLAGAVMGIVSVRA